MDEKYAEEILTMLFEDARLHFGDAIRGHWFYGHPGCPGCGSDVDAFERDGESLLSINAFIHRKAGVLIGYFLCRLCYETVQTAVRKNPFRRSKVHAAIETSLVSAYDAYLQSLDA